VRLTTSVRGTAIADGRSRVTLDVRGFDRWDHPAIAGSRIKVTLDRGDASFAGDSQPEDAASPSPGVSASPRDPASPSRDNRAGAGAVFEGQLGVGGQIAIPLLPGLTSGNVKLSIVFANLVTTQTFYVAPYLRKPFVDGLLSVGLGTVPIGVDGSGEYDGGAARRARAAIFAAGKVGERSLLTLAYESQNPLSPLSSLGPFIADPNERPYQTFGDSSTQTNDYRSNDRLYARLDAGRNSFLWGQFDATTGSDGAVGSFRELLSGANVSLANKNDRVHVNAFSARNDVAYVSLTVPVSGLSALAQPLEPDIVVGSDYLTLSSIDRRTGAILSATLLIRNVDYTIDYATGVLRFINIPLPFDQFFNPQVLTIQYQYQGIGVRSQTTGGNVEFDLGKGRTTHVNVGYVNDATGATNFSIFSQSVSGKLSGGQWTISHATSNGLSPTLVGGSNPNGTHGGAFAFSLNDTLGTNQLGLQYQDTGIGFADPFGGIANPGFTNYRIAVAHRASDTSQVVFEADGQKNHGIGEGDAQNNVSLLVHKIVSKSLSVTAGLISHAQHNAPVITGTQTIGGVPSVQSVPETSTNTQAQVGFDWKVSKLVDLILQRDQTLVGNDAQTNQPTQTSAELDYAIAKKGKAFVRELLSAAPTTSFAQATGSLDVASIGTRSTQIGLEQSLSPTTTVDSEYLVTNTGNATNIYSALGVQQKFAFGKRLSGNVLVQRADASGPGAVGFTVYGISIGYTDTKDFRAGISYQSRSGVGGGSTFNGGFTGHLGPNISTLGAISQAWGSENHAVDDRISVAYRPSENDRLISLFGYQRTSGTSVLFADRSDVLSFEELYRPWRGFEVAGRFATKLDGGGYYAAHTGLVGVRVRQDLGSRFDIGSEVRVLTVANIAGAQATDFAAEAGYSLGSSARVAVGYNFSGSVDPTLTGHPLRKGAYLTVTTLVDHIFGWGKR